MTGIRKVANPMS